MMMENRHGVFRSGDGTSAAAFAMMVVRISAARLAGGNGGRPIAALRIRDMA
jgi:hypothetical protein